MNKKSLLLLSILSLSACTSMNNQDAGTLTGAVIGGVLGSHIGGGTGQLAATTVGAMIGSMIGNQIGLGMDNADRALMNQTLESNHSGEAKSWMNPDNGHEYTVTPTRTYYHKAYNGHQQPCREYTTSAIIGGKKQEIYGKACRTADGAWRVIA